MAAPPPPPLPPPPLQPPPPPPRHPVADNDDLIGEILLHIPPDDPTRVVRASAVCKRWRRILADPSFVARHRAFHPSAAAPVLGVLHNPVDRELDRFIPTAASSFRAAAGDRRKRHILDCRHGRVVLYDYDYRSPTEGHVVWDPITGEQHRIPNVMDALTHPAVISGAAAGGGGGDGSFIVAFVGVENWEKHLWDAHACFYSSETGDWSVHINIILDLDLEGYHLEDRPAALVGGDSLYLRRQVGDSPPVQVRPPASLRQEHPGPRHHLGRRPVGDRPAAGRQAAPLPRLLRRHGGAGERRRRAAAGNPAPPQARPVGEGGGGGGRLRYRRRPVGVARGHRSRAGAPMAGREAHEQGAGVLGCSCRGPQRHLRRHGRRWHLRRRARLAARQESVRIGQITRPFLPLRELLHRLISAEPSSRQIASNIGGSVVIIWPGKWNERIHDLAV